MTAGQKQAFVPSFSAQPIWDHARRDPGRVAVADSNSSLSYEDLRDDVARLALALRESGIRPGEPVLVLLDVCVESVIAYWALRSIDAVVVVGDPTCKDDELAYYLSATGARRIVAGVRAAQALSAPQGTAWHVLEDNTGALRRWSLDRESDPVPAHSPRDLGEDASVILFSSGTTGRPKAILHTTESLRGLHETLIHTWKLGPEDRVLGALPFHTIYGLVFSAASSIYAGASLILLEKFHPERALRAIEAHRITTAAFVPTMALMILNFDGREDHDLGSLRAVYTASAPISELDIERFAAFSGTSLIANYGLSEIPGAAVERADVPHFPGSVGRISPGFEVCVRDPSGAPLAIGETGEVTMRGLSLMKGYLGAPEQTAERIRDGWIYSQDIGRVDELGNIFLSGRASEMIIRGGLNISPREVETALSKHADVLDVAVIGLDDPIFGQIVLAVVVPRRAAEEERMRGVLLEHCRTQLPPAKVPTRIEFMDELPRNAGGKVLRKELQQFVADQESKGA
ncbi:MAG: AMP-binding protein [Proteobacteria bacterium]|nr:AMP-binding protein [Pseudomonadota bacterium]